MLQEAPRTTLVILLTIVLGSLAYHSEAAATGATGKAMTAPASSTSSSDREGSQQAGAPRRVIRETSPLIQHGVYPPRIGRPDGTLRLQKRAPDLGAFPRVGRGPSGRVANSYLQPFPRLGRAPTLAAFPRVGRSGTGDDELAWCDDCPSDMEILRQLARRAVVMPPRIGRSEHSRGMQSMFPRPRVGKRFFDPTEGTEKRSNNRLQGLVTFPRVGRDSDDLEEEDPAWFADPAKRSLEEPDSSRLWFGPRLGRKKREAEGEEVQVVSGVVPVYPEFRDIKGFNPEEEDQEERGTPMDSRHSISTENRPQFGWPTYPLQ